MKHEQVTSNLRKKRVSDTTLIESYSKTGNVWKTAAEVGLCGQTVYERLKKLNVVKTMNLWTPEDDKILLNEYKKHKADNTLEELARKLGRTKTFSCRKARALGLTDISNRPMSEKVKAKISDSTKKWIREKGHPRGALGMKHTEATKKELSERSKQAWRNPNSKLNSEENHQRLSDALHNRKMNGSIEVYSMWGKHRITLGGKEYTFKSSWEKNIAIALQNLKDNGQIKDWWYERYHFNFEDQKRGIRSYCPDFNISQLSGGMLHIEVKGWQIGRSMKQINMFKERYPNEKLYLIDKNEYRKIISESDYLRRRCE